MTKPETTRIRCKHCGRPIIWWLGMRWKHAAGGWRPQPKCGSPEPVIARIKD